MADLTSLYRNKPKRDFSIQACADCINKIALQFPNEFKDGFFTDYFDIAGGTQPPKSTFIHESRDGYVKFLQIRDFSSDSTPTFIPVSKNNKLCTENDIVLGRYGASVGKILTGKSGAYNVACAKILFLEDKSIDKDFLFYWLHSSYFQNFLTSISRSAQGGFNKNDLSRIKVLFPSIEIQRKLTSILNSIDSALINGNKIEFVKKGKNQIELSFIELIEKFLSFINEGEELSTELTHQLDLVKKLRQQLLQDAVQGNLIEQNAADEPASELLKKIKAEKEKLVAEKKLKKEKELPPIKPEEIPFEIPENWVWCRLGEAVILKRGKSKHRPRNDSSLFEGGKYPFIQTGDVARSKTNNYLIETINGHYNDFGLSQSLMQKKGTLCITIAANIAECGFLGFDACAPDSIVCLSAIAEIVEKYCFYYIIQAREDIEKYAPATAQKNINLEILNSLLIPLPPLEEQHRIVQELNNLMQYCNDLEESIKQSQQQNEKLLQQVLREALRKN
jgi:type I restriction enzyme S subunit